MSSNQDTGSHSRDSRDLELIRELAKGELSPEQAAELKRELASDAELSELADAYADVHEITGKLIASETDSSIGSALTFEQLEVQLDTDVKPFPLRRVAAASLIIGVGLWAVVGGFGVGEPADKNDGAGASLVMEFIPKRPPTLIEPAEFPAMLASYKPVADGKIQWMDNVELARQSARLTDRPLIVWGYLPTCPVCNRMKASTLIDEEVLARVEGYVPVRVDVSVASQGLKPDLTVGFPIFQLIEADGERLDEFFGYSSPEEFSNRLDGGRLERGSASLPWKRANELVAKLSAGVEAESAGELGDAEANYTSLAANQDASELRVEGLRGLDRLSNLASASLEAVVGLASMTEQESHLESACEQFAGTRFAPDFTALLGELRNSGTLPAHRFRSSL